MILDWLKRRNEARRKARQIYGVVVTQARQPGFYVALGVPDTPTGRYEMVAVHMALLLDRLEQEPDGAAETRRLLVETFVTDVDDAMRELGIGDLSVPKRVKRAAGGLHERVGLFRQPLAEGAVAPLAAVLAETALAASGASTLDRSRQLAEYMIASRATLAKQPLAELVAGRAIFARAPTT